MNPLGAHLPTFVHGQQQQIEVFEAFRELGEQTGAFPSSLRRLPRFTVGTLMILVQHHVLQRGFKGRRG
jgi:hypothetical protein